MEWRDINQRQRFRSCANRLISSGSAIAFAINGVPYLLGYLRACFLASISLKMMNICPKIKDAHTSQYKERNDALGANAS